MAPLIGIPSGTHDPSSATPGFRVNRVYAWALEHAGGATVILPLLKDDGMLREVYRRLDGLLLTGGDDVAPHRYGEEPHPRLGPADEDMDCAELLLLSWALADDLPVLAICRGQQILNVAAGGTLYQDIPSQVPDSLDHRASRKVRDLLAHPVDVEADSKLAAILGTTRLDVNTSHHQSVNHLAPGLVITARSPDRVIEGVESPRHRFVVGVQWHPEELYAQYEGQARLFRALVEQASRA